MHKCYQRSPAENAYCCHNEKPYGFCDDAPISHTEAARRYHLTKRRAKKLEASALHNIKTGYMPNTADWR